MLLNRTSSVLGSIPALPGAVPPCMVYVFPEFVTPYVNKRPLCPIRTSRTRGKVVLVKNSDCVEFDGNTCENVYRDDGGTVETRYLVVLACDSWGSAMRTDVSDREVRYGAVAILSSFRRGLNLRYA